MLGSTRKALEILGCTVASAYMSWRLSVPFRVVEIEFNFRWASFALSVIGVGFRVGVVAKFFPYKDSVFVVIPRI
jgi:hypothetical protein